MAIGEPRAAAHRADAGGGAVQGRRRPPEGTALDGAVEVASDGGDAALEPADVAREVVPDRGLGVGQAGRLGGAPLEARAPARHQGIELPLSGVEQGPGLSTDSGRRPPSRTVSTDRRRIELPPATYGLLWHRVSRDQDTRHTGFTGLLAGRPRPLI